MNKKYFIFVVLFILSTCRALNLDAKSLQNSCTLSVEIEGKEYKDLILRVVCHQIDNVTISATKSSETKWLFNIPDSVYEKHYNMELHVVDSISHRICFSIDGNKQSVANFSIGPGKTTIKTHFLSSKKFPKMPVFNNKEVIIDVLNITNPDTNFIASLDLNRVGFDMHGNNREEALSNFLSMTKKYGNIHCCTAVLYSRTNLFKSKDEVHQFYNVLSTEQKESYFGQKIKSFLALTFFPKIQLPTISDNEPRNIISDSTRYTLVVFSASWCGPCHKQIPVLQKVYDDLNKYGLDVVYVSMDNSSTIENWKMMVAENKIPWISFLSGKRLDEVSDIYSIKAIPTTYLVYPGGKFAKIDVRNGQERECLYSIIQDRSSKK